METNKCQVGKRTKGEKSSLTRHIRKKWDEVQRKYYSANPCLKIVWFCIKYLKDCEKKSKQKLVGAENFL